MATCFLRSPSSLSNKGSRGSEARATACDVAAAKRHESRARGKKTCVIEEAGRRLRSSASAHVLGSRLFSLIKPLSIIAATTRSAE